MSKKILVIDDEPDIVTFLTTLLRKNGYEVCEACDGVEGIKKVMEEKPDLVCLDLIMPEKTGIKMYREMRKDQYPEGRTRHNGDWHRFNRYRMGGFQEVHTAPFNSWAAGVH